jgi:MSHA pilin protein MshD
MRSLKRGFTLIELIVGIVLLAVALTGILGLLINQAPQAVDPVQQVRAAQLAQRLSGEILQKSFDEQSDHNGGSYRCGETVTGVIIPACSTIYGPDGAAESEPYTFNDVDDFDTAGSWHKASWFTQTSVVTNNDDEYLNYQVRISVTPDNLFGSPGLKAESIGKRILLQVKLPDESVLDFSFYRGNY